ncbi:hypothetical protein D1007_28622 [Hordeum vulgare]|nr:hypothetical protein D1007_28622 [Hordeum vulgare]
MSMGYGAHPSVLAEVSSLVPSSAMPPVVAAPPMPSALRNHAAATTPFYFAHFILVKLTHNDYLVWYAHVMPLLSNRYLEGYIDDTLSCPSSYHPSYHAWVAHDQAILSTIQSSLIEGVSSLVLFAATS